MFFTLLTLTADALGCGAMVMPPNGGTATNADYRAVLIAGEGESTMVLHGSFDGDAEDFAWLIPIPAPLVDDRIQVIDSWSITDLIYDTDPVIEKSTSCGAPHLGMYGCTVWDEGHTSSPTFLGEYEAGPYQIIQFATNPRPATSPATPPSLTSATAWLQNQGFEIPAELESTLKTYTAEGWTFLAVRIQPREIPENWGPTDSADETESGLSLSEENDEVRELPPLALTYASEDLV
ncbi:MAG: DUF2330 domain-containing protein, partial [Myxococcota bacterium]|nr:DUF2330 domain-containing protein [Myxococcota bacterium]